MTKQEIKNKFLKAMETNEVYLCYQPQYNHITRRMIGAEALMRWHDNEYGLQYPADFIPVLEETGLIYQADIHVFELICIFLKKCIDKNILSVPISFNVSRYDIFNHEYVKEIEKIRKKYDIPTKMLRAEITETSAIGGMNLISDVINQLHDKGYIVEMDDFGSGYSSLNVLKDLPVDIIKLDMRFLSGNLGGRGGIILNAIAQMSKWLNTPIIAEGVETMSQADYMTSMGCHYIQGFLYSKPINENEFLKLLKKTSFEINNNLTKESVIDIYKFADPNSFEVEFFNKYVEPAILCTYENGKINVLRVNNKYLTELGINITREEIHNMNPLELFGLENKNLLEQTIQKAIQTNKEEIFEGWTSIFSKCCGNSKICLRNYVYYLGKFKNQYLLYIMIRNITDEKGYYEKIKESEEKFRYASEHTGSYAWEYNILTKEMRPCLRCIRDLGLPALVENYPDPVFESGLFPREYEKEYRHWMKLLEEGTKSIEGIIPLTSAHIPFKIQYTTQFDDAGHPIKAYGSATPVDNINKTEAENIILALAKRHLYTYEIDIDTNHFSILYISKEVRELTKGITEGDDFYNHIKNFILEYISNKDKDDFLKIFSKENIIHELKNNGCFQTKVKLYLSETVKYLFIHATFIDEKKILFTIDDISKEITEQQKLEEISNTNIIYSSISKSLSKDYINLYYVNLETENFIEYIPNSNNETLIIERKGTDFFKTAREDALTHLHKDDINLFLNEFHKENILKKLKDNQSFVMYYRLFLQDRYIYASMKTSLMDDKHIIVGVNNVDEQMKQKEEIKKIEEERIAYSRFFALTEDFVCIYVVDPVTDKYNEYSAQDSYKELGLSKEGEDFFEVTRRESLRTIYKDDIGRFLTEINKENLLKEIQKNKFFSIEYRLLINNKPKWVNMKATIVIENNKDVMLIGVTDIDTKIRKKQEYDLVLSDARNKANIDALTGVKNKRAYIDMEDILNHEIAGEMKHRFGLAVFDVNELKKVNDNNGHQAGDIFLKDACSVICTIFKHSPVFRIGGDEFVAILQGHDYNNRESLFDELIAYNKRNYHTEMPKIACGIAVYETYDKYVSDVFRRADDIMYSNKEKLKELSNIYKKFSTEKRNVFMKKNKKPSITHD